MLIQKMLFGKKEPRMDTNEHELIFAKNLFIFVRGLLELSGYAKEKVK